VSGWEAQWQAGSKASGRGNQAMCRGRQDGWVGKGHSKRAARHADRWQVGGWHMDGGCGEELVCVGILEMEGRARVSGKECRWQVGRMCEWAGGVNGLSRQAECRVSKTGGWAGTVSWHHGRGRASGQMARGEREQGGRAVPSRRDGKSRTDSERGTDDCCLHPHHLASPLPLPRCLITMRTVCVCEGGHVDRHALLSTCPPSHMHPWLAMVVGGRVMMGGAIRSVMGGRFVTPGMGCVFDIT